MGVRLEVLSAASMAPSIVGDVCRYDCFEEPVTSNFRFEIGVNMFLRNIGTVPSYVSRCQGVKDKLKKLGRGKKCL